jgi:carboxyl-terminal processing protease
VITSHPTVRHGLAGLCAIAVAAIALLTGIWLGGHPSDLPSPLRTSFLESRNLVLVNQALNILTTRYYRPLNRSGLVDQGLTGMVASLDDPYSHYLDPDSYRERNEERRQVLGGIGINGAAEPSGLRVVNVFEGSPAAEAGLMAGDVITKVGSTSLVDLADNLGTQLIRGPVGTLVELTFVRDDVQHVISIKRANIVRPAATWEMLTYHHLRITHSSEFKPKQSPTQPTDRAGACGPD